jgi:uncharacterized protein YqeY
MNLTERIEHDMQDAMKAKNEPALSAIRLVRSALKNKQIDVGHSISDEEAAQIIRTMVKQYTDALADFTSAGRTDLAEKQKAEIDLLQKYLPAQMSEAEIEQIATNVILTLNATQKDIGRVIGAVMKDVAGRADENTVKTLVTKLLQ